MGSTREVTAETGQVQQRYEYDAFGAVEVQGSGGGGPGGPGGPPGGPGGPGGPPPTLQPPLTNYLFTGREYQPESGLYNYRNRFFHPGLGRFVQADPIGFLGADANLYSYVWNNPGNWVDPSGEFAIAAPVVIGIVLAYVVWQSFEWTKKYPVQWPHVYRAEKEEDECEKSRGGENEAARRGREAHEEFKEKVKAKAEEGWRSEPSIEGPGGKILKPDAVTPSGRPLELKPDTPSGRARGRKQLRGYEEVLGKKGKVVYYPGD